MNDGGQSQGTNSEAEAIGQAIGDRIAARLHGFEDRMAGLEEDLGAEVGRIRSAAKAIDLLADEVRTALHDRRDDDPLVVRLQAIEHALQDRGATEEVDLGPVSSALADVLDAVAAQSERADTERRSLRTDLDGLRTDIGRAMSELGPPDLAPLAERIDAMATEITAAIPAPPDLGPIRDEVSAVADLVTASKSAPLDLSDVTGSIDSLHRYVHALGDQISENQVDLGPLAERIDALAAELTQHRPTPVDLQPIQTQLDVIADRTDPITNSITGLHQRIEALAATPDIDLTPLAERIDALAAELTQHRPTPIDLTPVTAAVTDLRTHLADSRVDLQPIQTQLDVIADRTDPITNSIAGLHQRIEALAATPDIDLTPLAERIDALAAELTQHRPTPVDLTPVTAAVTDLRTHLADSRVDLQPIQTQLDVIADRTDPITNSITGLHQRIEALAAELAEHRPTPVDLTPVTAAVTDLRTHLADSRVDLQPVQAQLTPIQTALAEVVDALAHQIDDGRTAAAKTLAAIEVIADRVAESRVDVTPIAERVESLAAELMEHRPTPVDLTPVTAAVTDLRTHLADSRVDLQPIQTQLDVIADRTDPITNSITGLHQRIEALAATPDIDLTPVIAAVTDLRTHLADSRVDLQPIQTQLDVIADRTDPITNSITGLHQRIEALAATPDVDLTPLAERIDALAAELTQHRPTPVDLTPVISAVTERTDPITTVITGLHERIEALAATPDVDLAPLSARIESLAAELAEHRPTPVDLSPVTAAVTDLRTHLADSRVDLQPIRTQLDVIADRTDTSGLHERIDELRRLLDLSTIRSGIAEVVEAGAVQLEVTERSTSELRASIDALASKEPPPVDLAPVIRAVEDMRVHYDESQPDLDALVQAMKTLRSQIIDSIQEVGTANHVDLAPVHEAIAELSRSIPPAPDLSPIHHAITASQPDLTPVRSVMSEILDSLAQGISESRNSTERVVRAIADIDTTPDLSAAITDLTPVLDGLENIGRRLDDSSDRDRVSAEIGRMAADLAAARSEMARSESLDQLAVRLDTVQSAIDSLRADEVIHEVEHRLARRVDTNTDALREKIDDQRVLADSLAANVSQLNAALTVASEEPQQLRRDLDRILEQLAERMGGAMRELRNELSSANEPLALSSVEAGLDRITGRFQTDTGRILEAVAAAQEDADSRLRRIDNQVTELRRAVEMVRRESNRFETASPS